MSPRANANHRAALLTLTGALGCLLLSDDTEVAVRVSAVDEDALTLDLARDDAQAPQAGLLLLEVKSGRGIMRMMGDAQPLDPSTMRLRVIEVLEVHQRRNFVRVRAPRPILIDTGPDGPPIDSFALDLSGGGLLLAGPDYLEEGQRMTISLRLERDGTTIVTSGRVVRVDDDGRRGVTFDEISDEDRERLIHFIFDRERAERRSSIDG
jgi:hypothetical protein